MSCCRGYLNRGVPTTCVVSNWRGATRRMSGSRKRRCHTRTRRSRDHARHNQQVQRGIVGHSGPARRPLPVRRRVQARPPARGAGQGEPASRRLPQVHRRLRGDRRGRPDSPGVAAYPNRPHSAGGRRAGDHHDRRDRRDGGHPRGGAGGAPVLRGDPRRHGRAGPASIPGTGPLRNRDREELTTMRFMMLVIPKGYEKAPAGFAPPAELVAKMTKYNESLTKAGVVLALDGLHPPATGARVRFAGGKPMVTDGPFTEAKEVLGGYWMIQVKSKEEAIEWASRCPASDNEVIEVRQVHEAADFPPEILPPQLSAREQELREELKKKSATP